MEDGGFVAFAKEGDDVAWLAHGRGSINSCLAVWDTHICELFGRDMIGRSNRFGLAD